MQDAFDDFSVKLSGKSILAKSPLLLRGCVFAFWVVMSLTILSSSAYAGPPQMCNDVDVTFVELEKSIVNHAYNFTVSSSDGIDCKIDLINIINETNPNFHANKTFDDKLWEWKNISHEIKVWNYSNFSTMCNVDWYPNESYYTCSNYTWNETEIVLDGYCDWVDGTNCTQLRVNGSQTEEQYWYDWKKCKMHLLTSNKKIFRKKMNGTIVIPENESKVFKYEFKTPITINQLAWGSKGIFHVEINNLTFEDLSDSSWWDVNWQHRRQINVSNYNLTDSLVWGYPMNFTIDTTGSKFMDNGYDVRIIYNGTGTDVELIIFNETSFNISVTNIFFALNTSVSPGENDTNYWIYYGNLGASMPDINETAVRGYKPDNYTVLLLHQDDMDSDNLKDSSVYDHSPIDLPSGVNLSDYINFSSYINQGINYTKGYGNLYACCGTGACPAWCEFNNMENITIEVRLNYSGAWSGGPYTVAEFVDGGAHLRRIYIYPGGNEMSYQSNVGGVLTYTYTQAEQNKTHVIAATQEWGGTTTIYEDGVKKASGSIQNFGLGQTNFYIGGFLAWKGDIDEYRYSNKTRTPIEMYFAQPIPNATLNPEETNYVTNLSIGSVDLEKEGDPGYFWANYSYRDNSSTVSSADCNITIYGGTPAVNNQPMYHDSGLDKYRYNYTPSGNVVYYYNITCTKTSHMTRSASSTVVISSKGGGGGTAGGGTGSTFTIYYTTGITANPEALNFDTSTGLIVSKDLEICLEGGSDLVTFKSGIAWLTAPNGDNIDKDACKTFSVKVNTVNMIEGEFNTTLQVFRGGDLAINVPVSLRVGGEASISAMLFGDMDTRNMLILGGIAALIYFGRKKGKRGWKI